MMIWDCMSVELGVVFLSSVTCELTKENSSIRRSNYGYLRLLTS